MKYYFMFEDAESCFTKQAVYEYMRENGLTKMQVFTANQKLASGFFFCKEFQEVGEAREGCGKNCTLYKARNGKSGRCIHSGYCYEPGEPIVFKLPNKLLEEK